MIEPHHTKLSVLRQCELIGLSRASYYRAAKVVPESDENLSLMHIIDEEYTLHPFYGSRKMRDFLRRNGYKVNRKRVQHLMQNMGIMSVAPKPGTSIGNKAHPKYPYLLRGLDITRANQVWCADLTYIRLQGGFVYLVAVMDWYSRKVLSWEISSSMDDSFCISALERAIRLYGKPEIFNTDQGVQFTGHEFTDVLKANNIKISMDGKGRWMDNVFIERLWRSVKYEDVYIREYKSPSQLRTGLKTYFQFYNYERPHQSFDGLTPAEVYAGAVVELPVAA